MKKIIFVICLFFLACEQNENLLVKIKHVFADICDLENRYKCSRADFYYVYHYQEKDSSLILSRFDSIKFDHEHTMHFIYFYEYDKSMPDTSDLNKETKFDKEYDLKDYPGSSRHYKNLIYFFDYHKSYISMGKRFPDGYEITSCLNGIRRRKFFVKDSITLKYIEVNYDTLYPDASKIPH